MRRRCVIQPTDHHPPPLPLMHVVRISTEALALLKEETRTTVASHALLMLN